MRFDTPAADRITAATLFALGAAMSWGGFVMDRLEIRQIHPASIPGLVPMILGAAMMLCAVLLALSTRGQTAPDASGVQGNWTDFGFAAAWSCVFALLLVGTLPFAAAAALYIFVFAGWFSWQPAEPQARNAKRMIFVAVFAVAVAVGVAALFRYGFLVRLP